MLAKMQLEMQKSSAAAAAATPSPGSTPSKLPVESTLPSAGVRIDRTPSKQTAPEPPSYLSEIISNFVIFAALWIIIITF